MFFYSSVKINILGTPKKIALSQNLNNGVLLPARHFAEMRTKNYFRVLHFAEFVLFTEFVKSNIFTSSVPFLTSIICLRNFNNN